VPKPNAPLFINCIRKINIKQINEIAGSSKEMVVEFYVSVPSKASYRRKDKGRDGNDKKMRKKM
jgi:hypothetical protein